MDLTELIIWRELPFSLVEDPKFRKFIGGLCPKFKLVTRSTVRSDCVKLFEAQKHLLKEFIQIQKPRVCLTTDTWTSSNELPFMAITVHFIDIEWRLHKKSISFCIIPIRAIGENLADIIVSCLLDWNIEIMCTITMDNCSTNNVVARSFIDQYEPRGLLLLNGRHLQVLCWAHIINLVVQDGLDEIKESIFKVESAVKYVKSSPRRKMEFLQYDHEPYSSKQDVSV